MANVGGDCQQLRLLSLDGGGVRGLSSLLILKKLLESVAVDPDDTPKPCDHFDMIGGTSTGGLIAIMLGRLGMTVDECIAEYKALSPSIFTKIHRMKVGIRFQGKPDLVLKDRFDHEAIETGIRALLIKRGMNPESFFKETLDESKCKTFVCATSGETSETVVLSNYYSRRRGNDIRSIAKIWEVARATSAASSFFKAVNIGSETFKDGGTGANNPIQQIWNEATDIFGNCKQGWRLEDHLKVLVSIGTGIPLLTAFGDSVKDVGKALVAVSTNTVQVHNLFHQQHSALFRQPGCRAFRFNVIQGLEQVGLEEESKVPVIEAATRRYIALEETFVALEACASIIQSQTTSTELLKLQRELDHPLDSSHAWYTEVQDLSGNALSHTRAYEDWIFLPSRVLLWFRSSDDIKISSVLDCAQKRLTGPSNTQSPSELRIVYYFSGERTADTPPSTSKAEVLKCLIVQVLRLHCTKRSFHEALTDLLRDVFAWTLPEFCSVLLRKPSSEKLFELLIVIALKSSFSLFFAIENVDSIVGYEDLLERLSGIAAKGRHRVICSLNNSLGKLQVYSEDVRWSCVKPDTEYLECLECLKFERQNDRLNEISHVKEGSTDWIWTHASYEAWQKEVSAILWIKGKPGSGKSVLAKAILDICLSQNSFSVLEGLGDCAPAQICSWFYSTRGGKVLMSHQSLFRALLYQLLMSKKFLFEQFKIAYRKARPQTEDWMDGDTLKAILEDIVKTGLKAICVVDAMDESEDAPEFKHRRESILKYFGILVSEVQNSKMKFIILSRPEPEIEKVFLEYSYRNDNIFEVDIARWNGTAIEKIIDSGIESMKRAMHPVRRPGRNALRTIQKRNQKQEDETCRNIKTYLVTHANGVVLWVALILETLKAKIDSGIFTFHDLQQVLTALPKDIMPFYRHIIRSLIERHDDETLALARKALMWVSGANAQSSLTIAELHEALAVPDKLDQALFKEDDAIEDRKLPFYDWNEFRRTLRTLCGPLIDVIRVTQDMHPTSSEDEVCGSDLVQLLHRTAKDVLADPEMAQKLSFQDPDAQELVARTVANYGPLLFPPNDYRAPYLRMAFPEVDSPTFEAKFTPSGVVEYLDRRSLLPFVIRAFPEGTPSCQETDWNMPLTASLLFTKFIQEFANKSYCFPKYCSVQNKLDRMLFSGPNIVAHVLEGLETVGVCSAYLLYACDSGALMAILTLLHLFSVYAGNHDPHNAPQESFFYRELPRVLQAVASRHGLASLSKKLDVMQNHGPPPRRGFRLRDFTEKMHRSFWAVDDIALKTNRLNQLHTKNEEDQLDPPSLAEVEVCVAQVAHFIEQKTPSYQPRQGRSTRERIIQSYRGRVDGSMEDRTAFDNCPDDDSEEDAASSYQVTTRGIKRTPSPLNLVGRNFQFLQVFSSGYQVPSHPSTD